MPRMDLARISAEMVAQGEQLVLTNGCFDLIHAGHVRYLEAARMLGDALAVAINSDSSVRKLKGEQRPLTPEDDRAEVVAALACVDFVLIFPEETAADVVGEVRPAVYVKGGDYSADPNDPRFPVEGRVVNDYGGKVVIVDYLPGRSTTSILARLAGDATNEI